MNLPLRPNVCMIVLNSENKVFLGERAGEPGVWQFPQGGIEADASIEESVIRELHEELGAEKNLFQIIRRLDATHEYDFARTPPYAVGKFRGQAQSFWLVRFVGTDQDINLSRFEVEFTNFRWVSLSEVLSLAEPKRVPGYAPALAEAAKFLNPS